MPFIILSIIIQAAFVMHVVKTGRNTTWIWIIVMLPLAGSVAYLVLEVLPGIQGSRAGRSAAKRFDTAVNPNKNLNKAATDYSISDTVDNSLKLADELMNKGAFGEAKELYLRSMRGMHKDDPEILSRLATSQFMLGDFLESKLSLDTLIEANPNYKNEDSHLLYARCLENLGDTDGAIEEYEVLAEYFSGPEAAYRYALLCKKTGNLEKKHELLNEIIKKSQHAGKHYNSLHKEWIKNAKNEL